MTSLEHYVAREGYNLDYHNGQVENIWGTSYHVSIEEPSSCFDISRTNLFSKKITLKYPCETIAELGDESEYLGDMLAHEVGHADISGITIPLIGIMLASKSLSCIEKNPVKGIVGIIGAVIGARLIDEIAVDIYSRIVYSNGWLSMYNFTEAYNSISNMF